MADGLDATITLGQVVSIVTGIASIGGLGYWMAGRFRAIEHLADAALDRHETKDQLRHEENLRRFESVSIALARLGWRSDDPVRRRNQENND